MNEEWRDIAGYEGYYQVSNLGRIRSLDRKIKTCHNSYKTQKGSIKKLNTATSGYKCVNFYKDEENNHYKTYRVHRLVALAFIPNPNNYPLVNHKDFDRTNNNVDNLEWCTYEYNNNYKDKSKPRKLLRNIKVDQYSLDGKYIKTWESINSTKNSGFCPRSVSYCLNDPAKHKTHKGFIWKFHREEKTI